ncbi:hypothetical protein [Peribacillus simplex]|uniref:hypothetical protein n=1 Tax=Peribacillus simplex TaxID=1478 RepID=UPI0011A0F039|nr:hypothetical protein [Peribacillus simplex]
MPCCNNCIFVDPANGCSVAEGNGTQAIGTSSHSEGYLSKATKPNCHAEGLGTTAGLQASHSEGLLTVAGGFASHAEGSRTQALADFSHAEGFRTVVRSEDIGSHIMGFIGVTNETRSWFFVNNTNKAEISGNTGISRFTCGTSVGPCRVI